MSLMPEEIEAIAQRVAELIADRLAPPAPRERLVDAAQLAGLPGVERDWVYAHADQLGGVRLGGPKGRLRFDLNMVADHLDQTDRPHDQRPAPPVSRRPGDGRPSTFPPYHLQSRSRQQSGRAARQRPRP
jgi:hypothetical protein